MRAREKFFEVGKNSEGRCQTIGNILFILPKKLRMGKPDGKLLEMLT